MTTCPAGVTFEEIQDGKVAVVRKEAPKCLAE